jgi:tetratricopeptide (TPR) repeat protein
MALDKNKIIAEATKLVQKGAYDKAIKTYEKILAEDAKDVRVLLKVGELHQKKGDDRAAADAFKKVADTYSEQGFFLKAVAVYKQIVKLDPDDVRVNERLAGLYQQLGLLSDAMSQYQLMAAAYEKAGDAGRLVDVLKRTVELDPDNVASSIKLGDLYARSNDAGSALQHLRRAADQLKRQSRAEEYLKVAERISALQGDDAGLARELANLYLSKGDTKRALAKLQLCFKADPKDVETLTLLAQAFRDLGQTSKTASVYKELARVHEERGHGGEARATWRKVLELAPDDPDACDALGPVAAPAAVRAAGPPMAFRGSAPPRSAPPPGPPPGARAPTVIASPPPPPPPEPPPAATRSRSSSPRPTST